MLDTHVRLANSLGFAFDDLLAGVTWIPATVELGDEPGYKVEFKVDTSQ